MLTPSQTAQRESQHYKYLWHRLSKIVLDDDYNKSFIDSVDKYGIYDSEYQTNLPFLVGDQNEIIEQIKEKKGQQIKEVYDAIKEKGFVSRMVERVN